MVDWDHIYFIHLTLFKFHGSFEHRIHGNGKQKMMAAYQTPETCASNFEYSAYFLSKSIFSLLSHSKLELVTLIKSPYISKLFT